MRTFHTHPCHKRFNNCEYFTKERRFSSREIVVYNEKLYFILSFAHNSSSSFVIRSHYEFFMTLFHIRTQRNCQRRLIKFCERTNTHTHTWGSDLTMQEVLGISVSTRDTEIQLIFDQLLRVFLYKISINNKILCRKNFFCECPLQKILLLIEYLNIHTYACDFPSFLSFPFLSFLIKLDVSVFLSHSNCWSKHSSNFISHHRLKYPNYFTLFLSRAFLFHCLAIGTLL